MSAPPKRDFDLRCYRSHRPARCAAQERRSCPTRCADIWNWILTGTSLTFGPAHPFFCFDGRSLQLAPRLEIFGVGGLRLADYWKSKGGPEAYYGLAVPNFPNFFMLLGRFIEALTTDLALNSGVQAPTVPVAMHR